MENEVRLNVKIPADLLAKIKKIAKDKGLNVSALTRLLLINYVEKVDNDKTTITSQD